MRFPYKVKDFKSVQKNFDYLTGWLAKSVVGVKVGTPPVVSGVRSTGAITMAAGLSVNAYDVSGFTVVKGYIVIDITPVTHNNWTWYPAATGIVFINSGVAQTVTVSYMVVGT